MFHIKALSKPVFQDLEGLKGAKVHSIFKRVINLERQGKLISIQNPSVPKGSLSMNISEEVDFSSYSTCFRGHLDIKDNTIYLGALNFILDKPEIWEPRLKYYPEIYFRNKQKFIKTLKSIIMINGKEGGIKEDVFNVMPSVVSHNADLKYSHYNEILTKAANYLSEKDLGGGAKEICNLIGMGIGLTPSGDDFLVGVISVLHSINSTKSEKSYVKEFYESLCAEILCNLSKTTMVSRTYLQEAVCGNFSESFHNIYKALSEEDLEKLYEASLNMMAVGHSSGTDGLCGILWGFYQLDFLY
ncbi:DUF2877 domain-containing protein [Desnuesiella massiliensis]|uniref:DUF2877 domain-containing protein n=1 Tax=Desnuesiella massiliensis TaxID=1650662 RepID=UPI0006E18AAD|nr:DUF2877 domain-containing protein [Desnuesiella massiliensis]